MRQVQYVEIVNFSWLIIIISIYDVCFLIFDQDHYFRARFF